MGTDLRIMLEVSHDDGNEWHILANSLTVYQVPRDYVLYAVLGDVRNRSGHGSRRWQEPHRHPHPEKPGEFIDVPGWWYDSDDGGHDHLIPISTPRGVPQDATMAWKAEVAIWEAQRDEVITTYLYSEDILGADLSQPVYREGTVTEEQYLAYRDKGELPSIHAAVVGGDGIVTVNEIEYASGVRGEHETAVHMRWRAGTVEDSMGTMVEMVKDLERYRPSTSRLRFMLLFES